MILKEIVNLIDIKKLKKSCTKLYPKDKKNWVGFELVFNILKNLKPKSNKNKKEQYQIHIEKVANPGERKKYWSVYGIKLGEKKKEEWDGHYSFMLTKWNEWLAFSLDQKIVESMSIEDIMMLCLWEMTWCGFDYKDVDKFGKELKRRSIKNEKDIKAGKKFKTLDDLKKDLFA